MAESQPFWRAIAKPIPRAKPWARCRFLNIAVRMLAPDVALVTGEYHLARSAAGGGDAAGHYTLILRKTSAGWKIIHDHTSS